jgi:hypothetical protein
VPRLFARLEREARGRDEAAIGEGADHGVLRIGCGVEARLPERQGLRGALRNARRERIRMLRIGLQHQRAIARRVGGHEAAQDGILRRHGTVCVHQ